MANEDQHPSPEQGEFRLLHYINILLKRRWLILGGVFFLTCLAAVHYKFQTPLYTARARFLPSRTPAMSSRLDAVMGGGGNSYDYYSGGDVIQYYSEIISSSAFLERIVKKAYPSQGAGEKSDLISYYRINAASESEKLVRAAEAISSRLDISTSRQQTPGSSISISYSDSNPQMAAAVANAILDELVVYNQDVRNSSAKQNRNFIENRLKETQDQLKAAEEAHSKFTAGNKKIVTPELEVERLRLERNVTVQSELYVTLRKQLELAKIEEQERAPSIEILDHATVPLFKSGATLKRKILGAAFLAIFAFCGLAFLLEFVGNIDTRDKRMREFLEQVTGTKNDVIKVGRLFGLVKKKKGSAVKSGP